MPALRRRQNIANLSSSDIDSLRQSFRRIMNDQSINGYNSFVEIHNAVCTGTLPPHKNELFLPWHRAYIYQLETELDVPLPYWDWVQTPGIPETYASNGGNPLYFANRLTDAERAAADLHLPSQDDVLAALNEPDFWSFGGGYNGWVNEGQLEILHDGVHNWVGGAMEELPTSPQDPIFWAHHANVDRLWANWETQNGGTPHYLKQLLPQLDGVTVGDTLNIRGPKMGYEYVELAGTLEWVQKPLERVSEAKPWSRIPRSYSRAQLRFEGLVPVPGSNVPLYFEVFLNGSDNIAGRLPVFGVRDSSSMPGMRDPPQQTTLVLDVTAGLSRLSKRSELRFTVLLSHLPGSHDQKLKLGFDNIDLVFLP